MGHVQSLLARALLEEGAAAVVTLTSVEGSSPREAGVRMVVRPSGGFSGTVGGGALEWRLLGEAREALASGRVVSDERTIVLGPDLGQCCGGRVRARIETFRGAAPRGLDEGEEGTRVRPVHLFGAGHVGRALVVALAPLPFKVVWIDPRPDAYPDWRLASAEIRPSQKPADELADAPNETAVIVMTHSHPLDLDIVARALLARRFAFVALIGSATKRARFEGQMRPLGLGAADFGRLHCPIGLPTIRGKEPAVIAASIAAQLLELGPPG